MKKGHLRGIEGRWPLYFAAPLLALGACASSPSKPGFQQLGGSGGAGSPGGSQSSSHSTSAQTSVTTASSTTVASSSSSATGSSSSASTCIDTGPGEPNEDEQHAYNLGDITDCDNTGSQVSGVVDTFDIDWYRYHATDTVGCIVDPTRSLQSSAPIRLCKFAQCDNGLATSVSCPSGTDSQTSPVGRPGCCGFGGFTMGLSCGSSSLNSYSATIFLRIDDPQANPCVSYTLAYHF